MTAQRGDFDRLPTLRNRAASLNRVIAAGAALGIVLPPVVLAAQSVGQEATASVRESVTAPTTSAPPAAPATGTADFAPIFPTPDQPQPWSPDDGPLFPSTTPRTSAAPRTTDPAPVPGRGTDPAPGQSPAEGQPADVPSVAPGSPAAPPPSAEPVDHPGTGTFGDGCETPGNPVRCEPDVEPEPTPEPEPEPTPDPAPEPTPEPVVELPAVPTTSPADRSGDQPDEGAP